jgi:hypothetical protein
LIKEPSTETKKIIMDFCINNNITHITRETPRLPTNIGVFMNDMKIGSIDVNLIRVGNENSIDLEKTVITINKAGIIPSGYDELVTSGLFYVGVGTLIYLTLGPVITISSGVSIITLKGTTLLLGVAGVKNWGLL